MLRNLMLTFAFATDSDTSKKSDSKSPRIYTPPIIIIIEAYFEDDILSTVMF